MDDNEIKGYAKALSKCRTCNHLLIAHFKNPKLTCLDANITKQGTHTRCTCILFIPTDNLEFLEWAAENKEKKG